MPQDDPIALLQAGAARHAEGQWTKAEWLYRQVLKRRPQDPNAHNLLGVLARQRGDAAGALRHTERALAASPEEPVFLANRGAALAEAGRLAEAVIAFRAALARRPEDPVTLRNLGQALCGLGDPAAALPPLAQAAALLPEAPEPRLALAHARREAGDAAGAAAAAGEALARAASQPALAEQARFLLAALGGGPAPGRAPAAYVRDLFDQFAPRFEAELTGRLDYRTPALLAGLLERAGLAPARRLRVLDLGCGTGLSGAALAGFARRLEGLDLSPRMLAEARRRGLYDALHEADLLDWLPRHPGGFDVVAAADVLNYLGDLAPALAAIHGALAPGGVAAFSLEAGVGAPFALGAAMRFRHDAGHVAGLAEAAGFAVLAQEAAVLRQEKGAPVEGLLFVLRRD
ncbi:methyltransferase domain-containing protein [Paracraurococcus lichenis]|uniref:Methyltransferase domain-containing protein n=1 Tax=Paracraurococcus lichenis TaxID=3064888 RepID=A0ABT9E6B9_9PROT|nr:methyltransferase domain-containing protein [Paracraurococcus sp. LOR1-02]MDO9711540.1 methyltransferase domain-containing protein [Paracraurococcus sp. LOR1-02]